MSGGPAWIRRLTTILYGELDQARPRHRVLGLASRMIPTHTGNQLRVSLLRARGIEIGEGTVMYDTPELSGGDVKGLAKLVIGKDCVIDIGCSFELGDPITIGSRVTLCQQVLIITTTHELGPREHRAGFFIRSPVVVEEGAWIGPRSIILPGVTIGTGAIVDPGSIVNKSVDPNTRVRGAPARLVEELTP
jgi:maltose O-acetyltransferase